MKESFPAALLRTRYSREIALILALKILILLLIKAIWFGTPAPVDAGEHLLGRPALPAAQAAPESVKPSKPSPQES